MPELLRSLVEAVWPDSGLGTARRNAWAAMAAGAKRARERAETAAVVDAAAASHPLATPTTIAVSV
jgi:hypothetical protein